MPNIFEQELEKIRQLCQSTGEYKAGETIYVTARDNCPYYNSGMHRTACSYCAKSTILDFCRWPGVRFDVSACVANSGMWSDIQRAQYQQGVEDLRLERAGRRWGTRE